MHRDSRVRCTRLVPIMLVALAIFAARTDVSAAGLDNILIMSPLGAPLRAVVPLIGVDDATLSPQCLQARLQGTDGAPISTPSIAVIREKENTSVLLTTLRPVNDPTLKISVAIGCGAPISREFYVLLDPVVASNKLRGFQSEAAASVPASRSRSAQKTASAKNLPAVTTSELQASNRTVTSGATSYFSRLKLSDMLVGSTFTAVSQDNANTSALNNARRDFAELLRGQNPFQEAWHAQQEGQREIAELHLVNFDNASHQKAVRSEIQMPQQRSLPNAWEIGLSAALACALAVIGGLALRLGAKQRPGSRILFSNQSNVKMVRLSNPTPAALAPLGSKTFHDAMRVSDTSAVKKAAHSVDPFAGSQSSDLSQIVSKRTEYPPDLFTRTKAERFEGFDSNFVESNAAVVEEWSDETYTRPRDANSLKVEEISDMVQEAEFWISLNDRRRAIEILEQYGASEPPASPIPWLLLLKLYKETDAMNSYDGLRERAKTLFNASFPKWDSEESVNDGHSLEDFPHVIESICNQWGTDQRMEYLSKLIFDNRAGSRQGFSLNAYLDIMLLIAVAGATNPAPLGVHADVQQTTC